MEVLGTMITRLSIITSVIAVVYIMGFMKSKDKRTTKKEEELRRENRKKELDKSSGMSDYNYILNQIAVELVNYRVRNEIHTETLAERLNVSPEYIGLIEREEADLTLKELVDLVNKLKGKIKLSISI